jgi:hypothetical protein
MAKGAAIATAGVLPKPRIHTVLNKNGEEMGHVEQKGDKFVSQLYNRNGRAVRKLHTTQEDARQNVEINGKKPNPDGPQKQTPGPDKLPVPKLLKPQQPDDDDQVPREKMSVAEAQKRLAKDFGIKSDFTHPNGDMKADDVALVYEAVSDFAKRFPGIKLPEQLVTLGPKAMAHQSYIAQANERGSIQLNTKFFVPYDPTAKATVHAITSLSYGDKYFAAPGLKSIIHHEMGHLADFQARANRTKYRDNMAAVYKKHLKVTDREALGLARDTRGEVLSGPEGKALEKRFSRAVAKKLSKYGATDRFEVVAESFAAVMHRGKDAPEFARDVVNAVLDAAR